MSHDLEFQVTRNLHRWQESGAPYRWLEYHQGRWNHSDWQALLADLERSGYWPMSPDALGRTLEESKKRWRNLHRWQLSGQPRQWVDAHLGQWHHNDWLQLLEDVRSSGFWPLDQESVGRLLEELKEEWHNLQRWQQSGGPRAWVEAHQGNWSRQDWLELLAMLQQSEFSPLNPDAAEELLNRVTAEWWNLVRWEKTSLPQLWVEAHKGQWNHEDWLQLLDELGRSQYWPMNPEAIGQVLEKVRREYVNLQRWQDSGEPERWAATHEGNWSPQEWQSFLESLRHSGYWPMNPVTVEVVIEQFRWSTESLRRWQESGAGREWVEFHHGRWDKKDWLELLGSLRRSEYWPMDPEAIAETLLEFKQQWWNLRRWRVSGLARQWVDAHKGGWSNGDWLDLLGELQGSDFWPTDPRSLRRVLEEVKTEWWNLRRWQQSGRAHLWLEAHPGTWTRRDWLELVVELQKSEYWPLDTEALRQLLEGWATPRRQVA